MKRSDILISNYIIFFSLLSGTVALGFFSEVVDSILGLKNGDLSSVFLIGIFGSIFSFFTYGILVWPLLVLIILLIEIIGLKSKVSVTDCKKLFLLECFVIVFISCYLASKYQYNNWFYLIPIFSIGQLIRLKVLKKDF